MSEVYRDFALSQYGQDPPDLILLLGRNFCIERNADYGPHGNYPWSQECPYGPIGYGRWLYEPSFAFWEKFVSLEN